MAITMLLSIYLATTFHTSLLFNVFGLKPGPIVNTIYYIYNRSSLTIFTSWLVLQNWPNGEPSKKEEIKAWIRAKLLGKTEDKMRSPKDAQTGSNNVLERLVDKLNRNVHGDESKRNSLKDEKNATRKVSSSESTSDLSDHVNYESFTQAEQSRTQDKNNNTYDFYNRKLIDLPENVEHTKSSVERRSSDDSRSNDKSNDKDDTAGDNKRTRKTNSIMIWPKLSRSIYYSHFFYLIHSLFNVNKPQKSDLFSMVS